MEIRKCSYCSWVNYSTHCVSPKHAESLLLCPKCMETTFVVTPKYIIERLRSIGNEREIAIKLIENVLEKLKNE